MHISDRQSVQMSVALSGVAVIFLFWLIYFQPPMDVGQWTALLPTVNACLNATSATLLTFGIWAIRSGRRKLHAGLMATATVASSLFLIGYIVYHATHGDTKFQGEGWIRPVYFSILISHVLLSIVVLPMIFTTLIFAARGRFESHRRLARWTFPIWLYVSVTGVVIYYLLRFS